MLLIDYKQISFKINQFGEGLNNSEAFHRLSESENISDDRQFIKPLLALDK